MYVLNLSNCIFPVLFDSDIHDSTVISTTKKGRPKAKVYLLCGVYLFIMLLATCVLKHICSPQEKAKGKRTNSLYCYLIKYLNLSLSLYLCSCFLICLLREKRHVNKHLFSDSDTDCAMTELSWLRESGRKPHPKIAKYSRKERVKPKALSCHTSCNSSHKNGILIHLFKYIIISINRRGFFSSQMNPQTYHHPLKNL